jgi:hypothetical protein
VAVEDQGKVDESGVQLLDAAKRVGQFQGHCVGRTGRPRFVDGIAFRRPRPVPAWRRLGGLDSVTQSVDTGLDSIIRPAVQDSCGVGQQRGETQIRLVHGINEDGFVVPDVLGL